jgi:cell filamentation protein
MTRYAGPVDPYLIHGSDVLKNKLGLVTTEALDLAEARIVSVRALQEFPTGNFDRKHLLAHHDQLFSAIYPWAGKVRSVSISKGVYRFESPERITPELDRILNRLKANQFLGGLALGDFCEYAAQYYSDLNVVHPFREGNGRTQRRFFEQLALRAGYQLNWEQVPAHHMIEASIRGWEQDVRPMQALFRAVTTANR